MNNNIISNFDAVSDKRMTRKIDDTTYIEAFIGGRIITFRGFEYCEKLNQHIQTTNEYVARRNSAMAIIEAIECVELEMNRADYSHQNRVDYDTRMQNLALSALHHVGSTRLELA